MKIFGWQGINAQGSRVYGKWVGKSVEEVRNKLRQREITPLKVYRVFIIFNRKELYLSYSDVTLLLRELATLNSVGLPIFQILEIIHDGSDKPAIRNIITTIKEDLNKGRYLSDCLADYPDYFDPVFCALIVLGEKSGSLDTILQQITMQREKILMTKQKIRKAVFYPAIVLILSVCIALGLMLFVVPQFAQLFSSLGAQLPVFTRAIIALTNFLINYIAYWLILFIASIVFLKQACQRWQYVRNNVDTMLLKLPLIGYLWQLAILTRCFRVLAISVSAGLTLLDSLDLMPNISNNICYSQAFNQVARQIKSGQTLRQSLLMVNIFPPRVIQMIGIGEQAGCLDQMLTRLADYYEQQLDYVTAHLTQLVEPAIVIFLSVIIGSLVIAMYLPIFRLGSVI